MSKATAVSLPTTAAQAGRQNALRDIGLAALGAGVGVLAAGVAWPISLAAAAGSAAAVALIERQKLSAPADQR